MCVPVTVGRGFLVAVLQDAWHRRGDEDYLRLTRFFGTLLLINVAVGVVTGLVQEFQFGMAWSRTRASSATSSARPSPSRVSPRSSSSPTFLGLWLFGWGRLPKACIGD